jgi:pseudaminic acid synthase
MRLYEKIKNGAIYFIAEMSANHAGDLENALKIVHAAKGAGADCVKLQTYTADTMTLESDLDYFKVKGGLWDGYTLYDLYKEAHMPWEWQKTIKEEAQICGLDFLSTPFDATSVEFLEDLGVEMYKIASYELTDIPLLKTVARTGKPMLISTGMGDREEIEKAVEAVRACGNEQIVLLKCTSEYPADFSDMNLAVIPEMEKDFLVPVGFSDHSMGNVASTAAAALGACVIEKHFCLSRAIKNPDSAFSMEPEEFAAMVESAGLAARSRGQATYMPTPREKEARWCRRSVFASADIAPGETFTEGNIRVIRPSYGLAPVFYEEILGKKCAKAIKYGNPLAWENVEK